MMMVRILTVGTLKEAYWEMAIKEYAKRLSGYCKLEEISIKEEKLFTEEESSIKKALDAEGTQILQKIPEGYTPIALCIEGVQMDSVTLSRRIAQIENDNGKVCFIIGSSYGLADKVKAVCKDKLSFSKMTFPHQLARVMLYEAIYRSFTIIQNKKYHK